MQDRPKSPGVSKMYESLDCIILFFSNFPAKGQPKTIFSFTFLASDSLSRNKKNCIKYWFCSKFIPKFILQYGLRFFQQNLSQYFVGGKVTHFPRFALGSVIDNLLGGKYIFVCFVLIIKFAYFQNDFLDFSYECVNQHFF